MKKLSVITPAFNEEKNLPVVHSELVPVLEKLDLDWEWIIIDDHSTDSTPDLIKGFTEQNRRIKGLRTAQTEGPHALGLVGLKQCSGDCTVFFAADGQDDPQSIVCLLDEMKKSEKGLIWLTREEGREDPFFKRFAAHVYYFLMRRVMGIFSIPPGGGDMVLVNGAVLARLREIKRKNINILVAIAQLGSSQSYVSGKRRARIHGKTNFTFARNIKLFFDTLSTLNSPAPIRRITVLGFVILVAGFFVSASFPLFAVLFTAGAGMLMLGIIGEYLWRTNNTGGQEVVISGKMGEWS